MAWLSLYSEMHPARRASDESIDLEPLRVAKQNVVSGVIALDPERGQLACWRLCTG